MRSIFWIFAAVAFLPCSSTAATRQPPHPGTIGHIGAPHVLPFIKVPVFKRPYFDIAAFQAKFEGDMKNDGVPNYIVEFRVAGKTVLLDKSGYALEPGDGGVAWAPNVPMHVGSVSKLITAMAMVKLIDSEQNAATNPTPYKNLIANYVPAYWTVGHGMTTTIGPGPVDFRHVLQHRSGFTTSNDEELHPDFMTMKRVVQVGSSNSGAYVYQNVNYSLMRVLLAVLHGDIDRNATFPGDNDAGWDAAAVKAYTTYVQNNVFAPAGVSDATLAHPAGTALAYSQAPAAPGWNSGDLTAFSGCAGWHLTIDDLLNVLGTFVRGGTIVTPAEAMGTFINGYGIDNTQATPFGPLYSKGGDDFDDSQAYVEQAGAMFVPSIKLEAAIFVNMPMGSDNAESLLVNDFLASIKEGTLTGTQSE